MRHIDIHKISDGASFNRFHAGVLLWCALIIICDGYDLAVAGIALPSIMKDMGVTAQNAGFMVSSALFGMMFGAIFLGTMADRIGRRRAIAICIALFTVFTAAAGLTHDPYVFSAHALPGGPGHRRRDAERGGANDGILAEENPRDHGHPDVQRLCGGRHAGGDAGQGPDRSLRLASVFLAAGVPVLLIPFVLKSMPESMPFLIKQNRLDELKAIVARMEPRIVPSRRPLRAAARRTAPRARRSANCSRTAAASAPSCSGSPFSCACSWCMR